MEMGMGTDMEMKVKMEMEIRSVFAGSPPSSLLPTPFPNPKKRRTRKNQPGAFV